MDIHKPKPWRGWRELAKEVGTIVLGVLIAIGFEQTVEVLHHQAQVRAMSRKLREENLEYRRVIAYDLGACQAQVAAADRDFDLLSRAIRDRGLPSVALAPSPAESALPACRRSLDHHSRQRASADHAQVGRRQRVEDRGHQRGDGPA